MPNHRENKEFKPLLFDTTLRNPERIKEFLSVLEKYDSIIPTNPVINLIVKDIINHKLYKTTYITNHYRYNNIFNNESKSFSDEELEDIIKNSPQNHQEGGFDKGWPSRFFTWFKFIRALGLVYFDVDKPIKISKTGKMLIKSYKDDNPFLENAVFRNAMSRFHRSSPYIMAANENSPFPLLVATILLLKKHTNNKQAGIYRFEIPYFLCWKDNNAESLAFYILNERQKLGLTPSDESIYDNCKKILGIDSSKEKLYKLSNIIYEMPDEYIRKMRLTGMITLRGAGNYLDINSDYLKEAEYIANNYLEFKHFDTEEEYSAYAGEWDEILGKYDYPIDNNHDKKVEKFLYQVSLYSEDIIRKEFLILSNRNGKSNHPLFRLLDKPTRLEFLTALLIKKVYPHVDVFPNYPIDDDGVPTTTAGGNQADIICKDDDIEINIEVTMITSNQQNIRETPSIISHLQETLRHCSNAFSIFVAPVIHHHTAIYLKTSAIALGDFSLKFVLNSIVQFDENTRKNKSLKDFN